MAKILVIDDDQALLRALALGLKVDKHLIIVARSAHEGLKQLINESPDLVILDLGLPDKDGLEILGDIKRLCNTPIMVLSAAGDEERIVKALDLGASDYVTKPFGIRELSARIRAILRDVRATSEPKSLSFGPIFLDLEAKQAIKNGTERIALTSKEFDLLTFLVLNAGRICTHQMIIESVWEDNFATENQSLRAYVYRVRKKLGRIDEFRIKTIPGIGYILEMV